MNVTATPSTRITADVPPSPNVSAVSTCGALEASSISSSTSKGVGRPAEPNGREKKVQEPGKTEPSNKRSGKDQTVQITDLYSLGRVIDGGANGQVLEGLDKRNGEKVAIKKISIGGGSNENEGQMEIWAQVVTYVCVCVC